MIGELRSVEADQRAMMKEEVPLPAESSLSRGEPDPLVCSHCGSGRLILIEETPKPSWREILRPTSQTCPAWYSRWQLEDDRRFWDDLMGEGF